MTLETIETWQQKVPVRTTPSTVQEKNMLTCLFGRKRGAKEAGKVNAAENVKKKKITVDICFYSVFPPSETQKYKDAFKEWIFIPGVLLSA